MWGCIIIYLELFRLCMGLLSMVPYTKSKTIHDIRMHAFHLFLLLMAYQITSFTIVHSTFIQRKHQSSASFADDVIIYTSATSKDELESRLQVYIDNISNWYSMNKLCINKKRSNVMVIGSKWRLKSLNLDDFTISVDSDKLFLPSQAKYLGLWVRNDLSWDDHILELCRKMYYYFHTIRRLRKNSTICFTSQHI